jgi:hypothetical protein
MSTMPEYPVGIMGIIYDLEMPLRTINPPARRRRKPRTGIEADTPIVPRAVATAVLEEAGVWLKQELPPGWGNVLVTRANTLFARNARFRRRLKAPGDAGRDWLWAFTRHWLAALILQHLPDQYARLPPGYQVGHALPLGKHRAKSSLSTRSSDLGNM